MIIALLLTAVLMVVAFFVASLVQVQPVSSEEGTSRELWVYGVTLMLLTLFSGVLFLALF